MTNPKFYTVDEAAQLVGVHRNTIERWIRQGKLPNRRTPGGRIRLTRGDLVSVNKVRDL